MRLCETHVCESMVMCLCVYVCLCLHVIKHSNGRVGKMVVVCLSFVCDCVCLSKSLSLSLFL